VHGQARKHASIAIFRTRNNARRSSGYGTKPESTEVALRHVALPTEKTSRNYATALRETKATAFKMTIKSRGEHPPDSNKC